MIEQFMDWVAWPFAGFFLYALVPVPHQLTLVRKALRKETGVPFLEQARWPLVQVLAGLLCATAFLMAWEKFFEPTSEFMASISLVVMVLLVIFMGVLSVLSSKGAAVELDRWAPLNDD